MTVVAYKGNTVAVDKMATVGEVVCDSIKYTIHADGALTMLSGSTSGGVRLNMWYAGGCKPADFPHDKENGTSLIVFTTSGTVLTYNTKVGPTCIPYTDKCFAFGSGREVALGAMRAGASPTKAVMAAIEHVSSCGGGIATFELKDGAWVMTSDLTCKVIYVKQKPKSSTRIVE